MKTENKILRINDYELGKVVRLFKDGPIGFWDITLTSPQMGLCGNGERWELLSISGGDGYFPGYSMETWRSGQERAYRFNF